MSRYVLGIDQSTQGTKALIFDEKGNILAREDLSHRQIVNEKGWVEHDLNEIYANVINVVKNVVETAGISKDDIVSVGISNQRETSGAWRTDGTPVYNAIVWQCDRAKEICKKLSEDGWDNKVCEKTGIRLSPYFPAGKIAWILENVPGARELADRGELRYGTIDTYLVYRLTGGKEFRTDYSNASRTQLFNIHTLRWDDEICAIFRVPKKNLATVTDSDALFGETDFDGYLGHKIPIHSVMGDSHAALFAQGCFDTGMVKATYGTGSSVMMNVGTEPVMSSHGVVSSLAWSMSGEVNYVLEGNINYTGAVISWLKNDVELIASAGETEELARCANAEDRTYLVPAFTGLGAPYWNSEARGVLVGISRTTGRKEMVRASLDCIAYQITDIIRAMSEDSGMDIKELRVDGGPTKNAYLMQFQADIARIPVVVPPAEELSGMGAAYAAGIGCGVYRKDELFGKEPKARYSPVMDGERADEKYSGWKHAVEKCFE